MGGVRCYRPLPLLPTLEREEEAASDFSYFGGCGGRGGSQRSRSHASAPRQLAQSREEPPDPKSAGSHFPPFMLTVGGLSGALSLHPSSFPKVPAERTCPFSC